MSASQASAFDERLSAIVQDVRTVPTVKGLHDLIDQAVAAAEAANPPFRCRQGCFECCEGTMPVVTAAEWRGLHAVLAQQSATAQEALYKRTSDAYRSQIDVLAVLAARLRGEPAYIQGVETVNLTACAFLQEGKCGAYEARPALCRGYGYMTLIEDKAITPVMCQPAVRHIETTFPEDHALPRWEPFQAALNRLTRNQGIAHLPLWIMAQHDRGGFTVPPIDDPMDWAVRRMSTSHLVKPPAPPPTLPMTPIGRPKADQGLGLTLGRSVLQPRSFDGLAADDDLPFTDE